MNYDLKKILYKCIAILITVLLFISIALSFVLINNSIYFILVPVIFFALYSIFVFYLDIGNLPYYEKDGIRIYYIDEETQKEIARRLENLEKVREKNKYIDEYISSIRYDEPIEDFKIVNPIEETKILRVIKSSEDKEVNYITYHDFSNIIETREKEVQKKRLNNKITKRKFYRVNGIPIREVRLNA